VCRCVKFYFRLIWAERFMTDVWWFLGECVGMWIFSNVYGCRQTNESADLLNLFSVIYHCVGNVVEELLAREEEKLKEIWTFEGLKLKDLRSDEVIGGHHRNQPICLNRWMGWCRLCRALEDCWKNLKT
jgi:hypothetical protein